MVLIGMRWLNFGGEAQHAEVLYRELAAKGFPTTSAELLPPLRPGETNAAPYIHLAARSRSGAKEPGSLDKASDAEVLDYLKGEGRFLNLMLDASNMDRFYPDRDYDAGPNVTFPELSTLKSAGRLFSRRAVIMASKGDTASSLADFETAKRIARLADDEPILMGGLVASGMNSILSRNIVRAASIRHSDEAYLAALRRILSTPFAEPTFRDALRAEFFFSLATVRNMKFEVPREGTSLEYALYNVETNPNLYVRSGLPDNVLLRGSLGPVLAGIRDMVDLDEDRTLKPLQKWQALNLLEQARARKSAEQPITTKLSDLMAPVYSQGFTQIAFCNGPRTAALAYVQILLDLASGKPLPESELEQKKLPIDPTTQLPVRYAKTEDGFKVWTTGSDLRDDGGRKPQDGEPRLGEDLVYLYPDLPVVVIGDPGPAGFPPAGPPAQAPKAG